MKASLVLASLILALTLSTHATAVAEDRLPDGDIAAEPPLRAWYAAPTDRYPHGVLGDAIEAGALIVEQDGVAYRHDLPLDSVFEDITPRLVDADGDGRLEILTIKSTRTAGAALALYGIRDDVLVQLAETPAIGTPNRWLNPAGVADYDGDGKPEIAAVLTPHIGGILVLYRWDGLSTDIAELRRKAGYSTHAIGSRDLGLALTVDWDGDGVMDLLLPRQNRTDLVAIHMVGDGFTEGDSYRMRREIRGNLEQIGNFVKIPLRGGSARTITRPYNPAEKTKP